MSLWDEKEAKKNTQVTGNYFPIFNIGFFAAFVKL